MREAKKNRLREAWRGPLTAGAIARAAGIGETKLREFWAAEKAAGRLPEGPRPHFADRCKRAEPEVIEVEGDDDMTPIADPNRVCEAECAAALDVLRKHHPEFDSEAAQAAPAAWLAFDRKGMPTPSHAMLMRMCRDHDHATLMRAQVPA